MSYLSDYANNVSQILLHRGDAQAQAALDRGKIWGTALSQIGETIGGIPAARQLQKDNEQKRADQAQQRQLTGLQVQSAQLGLNKATDAVAEDQMLASAYQQSLNPDGTVDRQKFTAFLQPTKYASKVPEIIASLDKDEANHLSVKAARLQLESAQRSYLGGMADDIVKAGFSPDIVRAKLAVAISHFPDAKQYLDLWDSNPEQFKVIVKKMVPPKAPTKLNVNERWVGEDGEILIDAVQEPEKMYEVVVPGPNGEPVKKLVPASALSGGIQQWRAPQQPDQGGFIWARDPKTNVVRMMRSSEAAAIGAAQPDTADMRNKEALKKVAARAVEAVRTLGDKILTRVGPAQRAEAIKRGVEAVFGNDPDFQTYQDSRMALAGTLAVDQQGGRASDADVKLIWLPMVPDGYRDTSESSKLKWELIDLMRGKEPVTGPKVGDKRTVGTETRTWNGTEWVK